MTQTESMPTPARLCPKYRAIARPEDTTRPTCGVDLALVKSIVPAHQAQVVAESQPGGSLFSFLARFVCQDEVQLIV